jgi:parallel beta-helix repeat protein
MFYQSGRAATQLLGEEGFFRMRMTARPGWGKGVSLSVVGLAAMAAVAAVFMPGAARAGSQVTTITSVPYTICQSGNYALASNLTLTSAGSTAISICAGVGHVDLEGKGHTITDSTAFSLGDTGISVGDGAGYITVHGFTLNGFNNGIYALNPSISTTLSGNKLIDNNNAGIEVNGGSSTTISGNTATGNGAFGIWLADEAGANLVPVGDTVKGNTVTSNQTVGIEITGADNSVVSNTATSNTTAGIEITNSNGVPSANNTVVSNKATGNGTDLVDDNLPACYNGWGNNTFATKNEGSSISSIATYGCIR